MSVGRRGYPKEWRKQAAELRQQGVSRANIARELGIGVSTVARWFREDGVARPPGATRTDAWRLSNRRTIDERWRIQQEEQDRHRDAVGELTDRELFLVGVALYWAEGAKSKPWRRSHTFKFVNSDEAMIRVFLRWLQLVGLSQERLICGLQIHETADIAAAEAYWRELVGPEVNFMKTTLKRHTVRPSARRNVGEGYRGCLAVRVLDGAELYRRVAGTWEGIVRAAVTFPASEQSPVV